MKALALLLVLAGFAYAQNCSNYYNPSTKECACITPSAAAEYESIGWVEVGVPCHILSAPFEGSPRDVYERIYSNQKLAHFMIGAVSVLLLLLTSAGFVVSRIEMNTYRQV